LIVEVENPLFAVEQIKAGIQS